LEINVTLTAKVLIGAAIAGVVVAGCFALPTERFHKCGHPITIGERLGQFAGYRSISRHCCGSLGVIATLRQIEGAMETYRLGHGSNAVSFVQLQEYVGPIDYKLEFFSDGQRWSVAVPEQGTWAGNYLLTSDGRIHFNKCRPPNTNDVDLLRPDRK
jgi:hypothetical protein